MNKDNEANPNWSLIGAAHTKLQPNGRRPRLLQTVNSALEVAPFFLSSLIRIPEAKPFSTQFFDIYFSFIKFQVENASYHAILVN